MENFVANWSWMYFALYVAGGAILAAARHYPTSEDRRYYAVWVAWVIVAAGLVWTMANATHMGLAPAQTMGWMAISFVEYAIGYYVVRQFIKGMKTS